MFNKILIANRGEIACRIIRTARKMGVETVAVFSDADRCAMHVAMADEAFYIGPSQVSQSYLCHEKIIDAAQLSNAQAIHPGYVFLSENADFVSVCNQAGIVFIGPSADSINAMGLKDAAKILMADSGVPVVPGYHDKNQDAAHLKSMAEKIGWPVLIKARAGGGGKGMRLVESANEFGHALESAKREAMSSFADDNVIIEKFVSSPRHIEIQVFADNVGNTVHLFERDCSLQRRHQKVIEEAPAPGMTVSMRQAMGEAAVKAAKAVNYSGAGTVEFIVDASQGLQSDRFYFMEMNTRLQVEHPVTEAIAGVDLVEWQLRVAAGETLPMTQDQLVIDGHAIEVRLYAEDPSQNFMPSTGKLDYLNFPPIPARVDSGVRQGDVISSFYDPMIAKLIVHDRSRNEALASLNTALNQTQITGLNTNVAFLSRLVGLAQFASGDVDTGLIERNLESLTELSNPAAPVISLAALSALGYLNDCPGSDPWLTLTGWRHFSAARQFVRLKWRGNNFDVSLTQHSDQSITVTTGESVLHVGHISADRNQVSILIDDHLTKSTVIHSDNSVTVFTGADAYQFELPDQLSQFETDVQSVNAIRSPMPGMITAVKVEQGQNVSKGDVLMVMEAMKMEHSLTAGVDGIVQLNAQLGEQVDANVLLLTIDEEE